MVIYAKSLMHIVASPNKTGICSCNCITEFLKMHGYGKVEMMGKIKFKY